ncbi:MAG: HD-GYP domain-containing protein [Defluviitaleaceae bacterium]|nr:HD-GYP domain-containing protein [Defluviitaleaceae bacterium]
MRFVRVDDIKQGMEVARGIYDGSGVLMLRDGYIIDYSHISALKELGYPGIYIHDKISEGIEPEEIIDNVTRTTAIGTIKEMYSGIGDNKKSSIATVQAMSDEITDLVTNVAARIFESDSSVINVPLLCTYDEYTYRHSADVGVLSIALGKALGLTQEQMTDLGKAAFLHDIGKMFIPKTILHKPAKLTENEFGLMKSHSARGYDFVESALKQKGIICRSVLHHHERWDGAGYPFRLKGEQIPLYSRIIAVVDVFDAISSARPYKTAKIATEGYEFVMANSGQHFDPKVVGAFVRSIAPFPVGLTVMLSNGLMGVVIKNHPSFMSRPVVKAYEPENPTSYEIIDLAYDMSALNITIVETS